MKLYYRCAGALVFSSFFYLSLCYSMEEEKEKEYKPAERGPVCSDFFFNTSGQPSSPPPPMTRHNEKEKEIESPGSSIRRSRSLSAPFADSIFVLSVDGGGIRGIIPLIVLQHIETRMIHKLSKRLKANMQEHLAQPLDPQTEFIVPFHLSWAFDVMAGTSTGGIITLGLNVPNDQDPHQPKYMTKDLLDIYMKRGDEVFPQPAKGLIGSVFSAKYPCAPFEALLQEYFGGAKLNEAITNVLLTTFEMRRERLYLFESSKAKKFAEDNFYMRDSARSTAAAPTYFDAAKIKNMNDDNLMCADGGLLANNPALIAYMGAKKLYPKARRIVLLSIGTGNASDDSLSHLEKSGLLGWGVHIAPVIMNGTSDLIHSQLEDYANTSEDQFKYERLNINLSKKRAEMDNTDENNLDYLKQYSQKLIVDEKRKIKSFLKALVLHYYPRMVLFPQLRAEVKNQLRQLQLKDSPYLSLNLTNQGINDVAAFELGQYLKEIGGVQTLNLSQNPLTNQGILHLLIDLPNLEGLDVSNTLIDLEGVKLISENGKALRIIKVDRVGVSKTPMLGSSLALYLKGMPSLTALSLNYQDVRDEGTEHLSILTHLKYLGIRGANLTQKSTELLLTQFPRLSYLDIGYNPQALPQIKHLRSNRTLEVLDLSHMKIDDLKMQELALGLEEHPTLTTLTLYKNDLTHNSASHLGTLLANIKMLKILNLSNNGLGDQGIASLMPFLRSNHSLTSLKLSRNYISDQGAQDLLDLMSQGWSVTELDLSMNDISPECESTLKSIAKKKHVTLTL